MPTDDKTTNPVVPTGGSGGVGGVAPASSPTPVDSSINQGQGVVAGTGSAATGAAPDVAATENPAEAVTGTDLPKTEGQVTETGAGAGTDTSGGQMPPTNIPPVAPTV